jgi:hypothetical protein
VDHEKTVGVCEKMGAAWAEEIPNARVVDSVAVSARPSGCVRDRVTDR